MDARIQYREAAVRGASPLQLVIYLYEQAIEDVRRAIVAAENGQIDARTRAINHALTVIGHLEGTLDLQRGGEVAANLRRFNISIRQGLIQAQIQQTAKILERQVSQLALVHEAWLEVERTAHPLPSQPPPLPGAAMEEPPHTDWNA
jgi:flagellar secretion chaperone FliS